MIVTGAHEGRKALSDDREYEYNKAFMKSLGFKSDAVGWADIKGEALAGGKLESMISAARENNVRIRTGIEISLNDGDDVIGYIIHPDAFELDSKKIKNLDDYVIYIDAYKYPYGIYDLYGANPYNGAIREDVINILEENNIKGYTIGPWIPDKGRFESKQFYDWRIDKKIYDYYCIYCDSEKFCGYIKKDRVITEEFIGLFSKEAETVIKNYPYVFSFDLTFFETPIIIDKQLIEGLDIFMLGGSTGVSKRVKDLLISNRILSKDRFEPIVGVDNNEAFKKFNMFKSKKWKEYNRVFPQEYLNYIDKLHEKYFNTDHPERKITEKMAVDRIKQLKKDSDLSDFGRAARGNKLERIIDESLIPYYKISDGFCIENMYNLYSIDEQKEHLTEFLEDLSKEEQLDLPEGYKLIGDTLDGEWILLFESGRVVVFQMGDPDFVETWENIHEFMYVAE